MRTLHKHALALAPAFMMSTCVGAPAYAQHKTPPIYGPPDKIDAAPQRERPGLPVHPQRLAPTENIYPDQRPTLRMEIADGVYGTVRPTRLRITVPFALGK